MLSSPPSLPVACSSRLYSSSTQPHPTQWMLLSDQHGFIWYVPDLLAAFSSNLSGVPISVYKLADFNTAHGMDFVTLRHVNHMLVLNGRAVVATHTLRGSDGSVRYVSDQAFVVGGNPVVITGSRWAWLLGRPKRKHGQIAMVLSDQHTRDRAVSGRHDCNCGSNAEIEVCEASHSCTLIHHQEDATWVSVAYSRDGSRLLGAHRDQAGACMIVEFKGEDAQEEGTAVVHVMAENNQAAHTMRTVVGCGKMFGYPEHENIHGAAMSVSGQVYLASQPDRCGGGAHGMLQVSRACGSSAFCSAASGVVETRVQATGGNSNINSNLTLGGMLGQIASGTVGLVNRTANPLPPLPPPTPVMSAAKNWYVYMAVVTTMGPVLSIAAWCLFRSGGNYSKKRRLGLCFVPAPPKTDRDGPAVGYGATAVELPAFQNPEKQFRLVGRVAWV